MTELFGIPMGPLAAVLAVTLALLLAGLGALALRNRVFFKLGVRNVRRRRGRTALIVAGLMLGTTIVAAALASGDTMNHTIRATAVRALGATDEVIAAKGAGAGLEEAAAGALSSDAYFEERAAGEVAAALAGSELVDGVAPAIGEWIAVRDLDSRQTDSRVRLFASTARALDGFSPIRSAAGGIVSLSALAPGEAYLNADAADELDAGSGDRVQLLAGGRRREVRVREVVRFDGAGADGPAALLPLAAAQSLLGRPGLVNQVLVSNAGGPLAGARGTDAVLAIAGPAAAAQGLEVDAVKRDALDDADAAGAAFMSMFTGFGSFSIAAGILLVFLIFVMLAAERRGELGIARAVGTRRGHLVQMFVYEGAAYDLAAAVLGAALGVGIAYGMVLALAGAFGSEGIEIEHDVRARSIVVAYALGVLLTFVVVALSAWRVSRLEIVSAIRNLPPPPARRRRRHWLAGVVAVALGLALAASGVSSEKALPLYVGLSLALVGAVPLLRALGLGARGAFTAGGVALVVLWLLPFGWVRAAAGGRPLAMDFNVWTAGGLLVVVGAAWVIVYNADVLLGLVTRLAGRLPRVAPTVRMAVAYPLRERFRTGVTLAMFTLVVFTLVVGAGTAGSFNQAADDRDEFAGGWDVRAAAAPAAPLRDARAAVAAAPGLRAGDFRVVSSVSLLPAEARQAGGRASPFEDYPVRGLDEAYLRTTTFQFAAHARGFPDPWRAMAAHPGAGYAVIDSLVVPRRNDWNAGVVMPDFAVGGFYLEDGDFDPFPVVVRDPLSGRTLRVTVIGVLRDFATSEMFGLSTTQRALATAFGARAEPTRYYFRLAPGADARAAAASLESAFLANGLEADALGEVMDEYLGASWTFLRLMQGFMGLGLLVGVAALGVVSARAVVERRQQIGILRAIGFRRRMIQATFLLESSFVALTAIVVGTFLALVIARNVVADTSSGSVYGDVPLVVPWLDLTVIFGAVYAAALLTTLAPAVRASRIYPAEALRYE